ncbi:MAG: hypothetical protein DLM50_03370 [Candidatus Meridianibacter frigidus]|nr:MAG: hypothetical protein DLM50_03370 [Candidatus Eremiobacteraeota bacterium]
MNFEQAQQYLLGTVNETISRRVPYRLERMQALLEALGNPHRTYPAVHVGGTSGKGSTSTMIAFVLSAEGKCVGLHTKPHLSSMTERARINGVPIEPQRFAELLTQMEPAIDETMHEYSRPSYYETLLALTFLYFAQEHVDIAVIEVGVGGKLDGTNVLVPLASVITNVGLDHMEILGDTLEAIAQDKAGIAKPGIPLVSSVEQSGAKAIVQARCAEVGAPFVDVAAMVEDVALIQESNYGQVCEIRTAKGPYRIEMPLLGKFQRANAATAIVALETLPPDFRPTSEEVEEGFARVSLPGRMEVFPTHPAVVFDIAHNPDKARNLAASLREHFGAEQHYAFVLAVGELKDQREIIRAFSSQLSASFIFTSFEATGRVATKPQRLASLAGDLGVWGRAINDPVEALTVARRNADANDVVVVTGSTFIVADLRSWWLENVASEAVAQ